MKFRKKMTAILLTAIFMISAFAVSMPVGAVEPITEVIDVPFATVSVVYSVDSVTWTIDMDEVDGPFANGHANVGLIIGVGEDILYQVHLNGGTCDAFPWGTWLYSEYDPTGAGFYGWHTSEELWNTPVLDMLEISATGERYLIDNPDLVYTITISKSLLATEFKWALWLDGNVNFARIEDALAWSDADTTNFHTGTLPTPTTQTKREALKAKGVPGEGIDEAQGLDKAPPNDNFAARERKAHAYGHHKDKGGK